MTQHAISVVLVGVERDDAGIPNGWFRWQCRCGAQGDAHDEHQRAFEFGSQHLSIEREGGQA